jgi:sugar O-acyltransferase (sialic acid O-acetyltransferase NeuD family)
VTRIVILGAGGHAREVLEILLSCRAAGQAIDPVGFIEERSGSDVSVAGLPILGDFRWFDAVDLGELNVICAVGTPAISRGLVDKARQLGLRFANVVSPSAFIATSARLGEGVVVFPNVVVSADATVGDHVTLNVAATVSHDSWIGSFSSLGPGVHIAGNAVMGEYCFVGAGANVIQGIEVGAASVIGAGATVIRNVPTNVTVVGVPARIVGPASKLPMSPSDF